MAHCLLPLLLFTSPLRAQSPLCWSVGTCGTLLTLHLSVPLAFYHHHHLKLPQIFVNNPSMVSSEIFRNFSAISPDFSGFFRQLGLFMNIPSDFFFFLAMLTCNFLF